MMTNRVAPNRLGVTDWYGELGGCYFFISRIALPCPLCLALHMLQNWTEDTWKLKRKQVSQTNIINSSWEDEWKLLLFIPVLLFTFRLLPIDEVMDRFRNVTMLNRIKQVVLESKGRIKEIQMGHIPCTIQSCIIYWRFRLKKVIKLLKQQQFLSTLDTFCLQQSEISFP